MLMFNVAKKIMIFLMLILFTEVLELNCDVHENSNGTTITTPEPTPGGKIIGLEKSSISATSATIQWRLSISDNDKMTQYNITLKIISLVACDHFGIKPNTFLLETKNFSTNKTTFTFTNLSPYSVYLIKVMACNELTCGQPAQLEIKTLPTNFPTAAYSNLKYRKGQLHWQYPPCEKMHGPIEDSAIIIEGVSKRVKDYLEKENSTNGQLKFKLVNLINTETYRVRIFPKRNTKSEYTSSVYSELKFTAHNQWEVNDFLIWEIDERKEKIHLKWQAPRSPIKDKIDDYRVAIAFQEKCAELADNKSVSLNESCPLWDNYICASLRLSSIHDDTVYASIRAHNTKTNQNGPIDCSKLKLSERCTPPTDLNIESLGNGIINVTWKHPFMTVTPIKGFMINATLISTKLIQKNITSMKNYQFFHPISSYKSSYNREIYLLPSSNYNITIYAMQKSGNEGIPTNTITRNYTSASFAFDGLVNLTVRDNSSTITLSIPEIINATVDNELYIIVAGHNPCEGHSDPTHRLIAQAQINQSDSAWIAAQFPAGEYAGKNFTLGDNKTYRSIINCPLMSNQSYSIIVIVADRQNDSYYDKTMVEKIKNEPVEKTSFHEELNEDLSQYIWLFVLVLSLIIISLIGGIVIWLYVRKFRKSVSLQDPRGTIQALNNKNYCRFNNDIMLRSNENFQRQDTIYDVPVREKQSGVRENKILSYARYFRKNSLQRNTCVRFENETNLPSENIPRQNPIYDVPNSEKRPVVVQKKILENIDYDAFPIKFTFYSNSTRRKYF